MRRIGFHIIRFFMRLLGKQPLKWHYAWSHLIKWILKSLLHYRRDVIVTNLSRCFPEKPYKDIARLTDEYYRHMSEIIVETIWFAGCSSPDRVTRSGICSIANPELVNELWKKGKTVVAMDSHCGNWELLGGFPDFNPGCHLFGEDSIFVIYRALSSKLSDDLFNANRKSPRPAFNGMVESSGLLRHMLKNKNRQSFYVINNDQYPYQGEFEIGEFLHLPTTAHSGTASIAHKLGAAVVFMGMDNDARGHYTISYTTICEDASQMAPEAIMRKYYDILEEHIKAYPHNWLWSHKRWKNL